MKRMLSFILIAVIVLGLCACGSSGGKNDASLKVGYNKVNVTPDYTVSLSGYGDDSIRTSDKGSLRGYLYATCIAVNSGEDTILLFTVDTLALTLDRQKEFRISISNNTGIPEENIFFGATHCHSAPVLSGQYKADMTKWLNAAAQSAIADMSPATMSACKPTYEGMTFVRHYQNDDGTYVGSNFGYWGNLIKHAAEPDSTGVLVKFDREGDKKDVLMVNWQAHSDSGSDGEIGRYNIAPSWNGHLRDKVEQETGLLVAYFTGASGNLNKDSKIASEAHGLIWDEYGTKMGELVVGSLDQLQPVGGTDIKVSKQVVEVTNNHQWDHMVVQANDVVEYWNTNNDSAAATQYARKYDISSWHHARAILSQAARGLTDQLEINAFSIGDLGFITGTYEMFCGSGMYVKENSPFETTFIITGNSTYIPTRDAYETYRCYESDTSRVAVGTAELLEGKFVEMLNSLK